MKRTFMAAIWMMACMAASGSPLTPEQALMRLGTDAPKKIASEVVSPENLVYTARTSSGTPAAYIFNKNGGGYMVLSGDDVAYAVLGYSDTGHFDERNMAPAMKWWLEEYASQIEFASGKKASKAVGAPESGKDMDPVPVLMSTKWNQDAPFNLQCPDDGGNQCVTGCVATSMAQVMAYHKYPEIGQGSIEYMCSSLRRTLSMDFDKEKFDWDNMLDYYTKDNYTDQQANAVSYLMKACGYSVKMSYTANVSGATGSTISTALREYFKYDQNCKTIMRLIYSWDEWTDIIYDNIKNVGPVIINGQSPLEGGHSFVCDGYDGKGYFHFNWGWGGMSDGYFALDALNPDAQGIGGYAGGFNFQQNAIIGVQKPTGEPVVSTPANILQYGASTATVKDNVLKFNVRDYSPLGWANATDRDINVYIGARFESVGGEGGDAPFVVKGSYGSRETLALSPGTYMSTLTPSRPQVNMPELTDGRYKVTLVCMSVNEENADWNDVLVPYAYPNYVYLNVENGSYSVEDVELANFDITDVEILTPLYYGKNVKFKSIISNNTDHVVTRGVCPALQLKNRNVMMGESILVTLNPGESLEKEWIVRFTLLPNGSPVKTDTDFTLTMYDPETNISYGSFGTVTMMPAPSKSAIVSMTKLSIEDTEQRTVEIDGEQYFSVALVDNLSDFTVDFGYKVTRSFFDGQIVLGISRPLPEDNSVLVPVVDDLYVDYPFLSPGESRDLSVNVDFSGVPDISKVYYIVLQYTSGGRYNQLGKLAFIDRNSADVESITVEDSEPVEYYGLTGNRVYEPKVGELVIVKQGRNYRKVIIR